MSRKKANPAESLARFIHGIYEYYTDRGMSSKTAKARMIDNTLEETVRLMNQEKDVPDEMLVIMAQQFSRALNQRGAAISKTIKKKYPQGNVVPENEVIPLRDIKSVKDQIDTFIETYKGWSDADGTEKKTRN